MARRIKIPVMNAAGTSQTISLPNNTPVVSGECKLHEHDVNEFCVAISLTGATGHDGTATSIYPVATDGEGNALETGTVAFDTWDVTTAATVLKAGVYQVECTVSAIAGNYLAQDFTKSMRGVAFVLTNGDADKAVTVHNIDVYASAGK